MPGRFLFGERVCSAPRHKAVTDDGQLNADGESFLVAGWILRWS